MCIFAVEANEIVGAVNRSRAWPSFNYQSSELFLVLDSLSLNGSWNLKTRMQIVELSSLQEV